MNKEIINQIEGGSRFDDYDWKEVMKYAPFTIEEVRDIIACVPGEADGRSWHYIMKLKDGKFGYATGGCDYSGWGCQEGGDGRISDTLEICLRSIKDAMEDEIDVAKTLEAQIKGDQPYGLITINAKD